LSSLIRLVQNEQMKIYGRVRTWMMLGLLVLAVLFMAVLMKYVLDTGIDHVVGFMSLTTSLSGLAFIFAVIVAGDSVASEFSWGTIKLLLIRPASRSKILWAKYIAVLLFIAALLLLLFIASYFAGLIFFGAGGALPEEMSFLSVVRAYGFQAVEIVMASTLAFMISAVFRSSSLAIGLSIFLMFTASTAIAILARFGYGWVKFILFANTDLTPYFLGGQPLVQGMTLGFSVTMLALYWIVFMFVSWLAFAKRDVAGS